jgi:hypothetical protein
MNKLKIVENIKTNIEYMKVYNELKTDYGKDIKRINAKPITEIYTSKDKSEDIQFHEEQFNMYKKHITLLKNKNREIDSSSKELKGDIKFDGSVYLICESKLVESNIFNMIKIGCTNGLGLTRLKSYGKLAHIYSHRVTYDNKKLETILKKKFKELFEQSISSGETFKGDVYKMEKLFNSTCTEFNNNYIKVNENIIHSSAESDDNHTSDNDISDNNTNENVVKRGRPRVPSAEKKKNWNKYMNERRKKLKDEIKKGGKSKITNLKVRISIYEDKIKNLEKQIEEIEHV